MFVFRPQSHPPPPLLYLKALLANMAQRMLMPQRGHFKLNVGLNQYKSIKSVGMTWKKYINVANPLAVADPSTAGTVCSFISR